MQCTQGECANIQLANNIPQNPFQFSSFVRPGEGEMSQSHMCRVVFQDACSLFRKEFLSHSVWILQCVVYSICCVLHSVLQSVVACGVAAHGSVLCVWFHCPSTHRFGPHPSSCTSCQSRPVNYFSLPWQLLALSVTEIHATTLWYLWPHLEYLNFDFVQNCDTLEDFLL